MESSQHARLYFQPGHIAHQHLIQELYVIVAAGAVTKCLIREFARESGIARHRIGHLSQTTGIRNCDVQLKRTGGASKIVEMMVSYS